MAGAAGVMVEFDDQMGRRQSTWKSVRRFAGKGGANLFLRAKLPV